MTGEEEEEIHYILFQLARFTTSVVLKNETAMGRVEKLAEMHQHI